MKRAVALAIVALVGAAACTSGSGKRADPTTVTTTVVTPTTRPRPPGPSAGLSRELTAGKGVFVGEADPANVEKVGYVEKEYAAFGTATSYKAPGGLTRNGRWRFVPDGTAPYSTRVLVRRPADPKQFSGTVIVEWLNVSGGVDSDPDWVHLREEIVRAGHAWVGVTAQRISVTGGPVLVKVDVPGAEVAGLGLRVIDPERYGSLEHPGDGYAFDIYTQVSRAVRSGAATDGTQPTQVIAAGESQSAVALTTYYNGVQPLTREFDGFFVHSRFSVALPLVGPSQNADLAGAIGGGNQAIFRTDEETPLIDVQTETDVASIVNSYSVRQPDSEHFRLWEVAGTSHADSRVLGSRASYIDCGVPINDGPFHLVAKAALHSLVDWVETGTAPPVAPRFEVIAGDTPQLRRDADGIAIGGVRTPPVDVPAVVLSGVPGPIPSTICLLDGSTTPLPAARLAQLYPSRAEYLERYRAAADKTITAGFVLAEDRAALLAFARPARVGS